MSNAAADDGRLDLGDPATYDAGPPWQVWDELRTSGPVVATRSTMLGASFWSVLNWPEVRQVLGNDTNFSSRYGSFLGFGPDNPDPAGQRMLVATDGERRRALRASMQSYFSSAWHEPYLPALLDDFRSSVADRLGERIDFAQEIAWRVPVLVACRIFGLPPSEAPTLSRLANGVLLAEPGVPRAVATHQATVVRAEIIEYFEALVRERTARPGDDVVSALLGAGADGSVRREDVVLNLLSLLVAANETTRLALSGAVVAFGQHADQWRRIRADSSLIPSAVEEILRWTSPALGVSRTALSECVLGGAVIEPGDVVAAWLPSANRDARQFPDPYRFDVGRTGNRHVAFGHGPHHCIGAALARLEITALLSAFRPQVAEVVIDGPLRYTHSNILNGFAHTPVRLMPAHEPGRHRARQATHAGTVATDR
ncbi:cytochrome P450 [Micromonospora sp. CB01531]|uniref:cytochrome P450 n=1 Tax=Micromonospora sp. CB01531 TaxID=1718947 RepID=UPI00093E9FEF|nr:cytochrome P450 [Micromonospora sp. CB01531]OKI48955.1 hypothetical protein A6A27_36110 [Micromonospora sp. CB01531]